MEPSVFISSTSIDLKPYRDSVDKTIRRIGLRPINMADFGSQPGGAHGVSLSEVGKADIYILIVAHRYGYVPDGMQFSVTHEEYKEAVRLKLPCLVYMLDPEFPWDSHLIEQDDPTASYSATQKLAEFKRLISKEVRSFFTTPDNLAMEVATDLYKLLENRKRRRRLQTIGIAFAMIIFFIVLFIINEPTTRSSISQALGFATPTSPVVSLVLPTQTPIPSPTPIEGVIARRDEFLIILSNDIELEFEATTQNEVILPISHPLQNNEQALQVSETYKASLLIGKYDTGLRLWITPRRTSVYTTQAYTRLQELVISPITLNIANAQGVEAFSHGLSAYIEDDWLAARNYFAQAREHLGDVPVIAYYQALVEGDIQQSLIFYELALTGDLPRDRILRSRALKLSSQDMANALNDADAAIQANNEDGVNYFVRAKINTLAGKWFAAQVDVERAISLNPDLAIAYELLGYIQVNQESYTFALEAFNQAIALDSEFITAIEGRANVYQALAERSYDSTEQNNYYISRNTENERAYQLRQRIAIGYVERARQRTITENYNAAVWDYQYAIVFDYSIGENTYRYELANVYLMLNQFRSALLYFYSEFSRRDFNPAILTGEQREFLNDIYASARVNSPELAVGETLLEAFGIGVWNFTISGETSITIEATTNTDLRWFLLNDKNQYIAIHDTEEAVYFDEHLSDDNYLLIVYNINHAAINSQLSFTSRPYASPTPTFTLTPTPTPSHTATPTQTLTPSITPTSSHTFTPSFTPTSTPNATATTIAYNLSLYPTAYPLPVNGEVRVAVRMLDKPDMQGLFVTALTLDEQVYVLEQRRDWLKVRRDSDEGWVPAYAISPYQEIVSASRIGSILHDSDGYVAEYGLLGSYRDFILDTTFEVPYQTSINSWDFGVRFRIAADGEFRFVVQAGSDWQFWSLDNIVDGQFISIQSGYFYNQELKTSVGSLNHLRLVAYEDVGYVILNGLPITTLNLTNRTNKGNVYIGVEFFLVDEENAPKNSRTRFSKTLLWPYTKGCVVTPAIYAKRYTLPDEQSSENYIYLEDERDLLVIDQYIGSNYQVWWRIVDDSGYGWMLPRDARATRGECSNLLPISAYWLDINHPLNLSIADSMNIYFTAYSRLPLSILITQVSTANLEITFYDRAGNYIKSESLNSVSGTIKFTPQYLGGYEMRISSNSETNITVQLED